MQAYIRHLSLLVLAAATMSDLAFGQAPPPARDRLKDLVSIGGVRSNQLVGYGIVVGLNGTGDGNVAVTITAATFFSWGLVPGGSCTPRFDSKLLMD